MPAPSTPRRSLRSCRWPGLVVVLALLAAARPAHADLRIWEKTGDAATDDVRFLDLTAFIQPGYIWRQDDPQSPITDHLFWLQRARLGVRSVPYAKILFRLELELTPNPALQDAYVEYQPFRFLHVRAGQFLVPFLYTFQFNEAVLGFIDRLIYVPQSPDRAALRYLSPRDIGVMLSGLVGPIARAPHVPVLEYNLAMMVGRGANQIRNTSRSYLYAGRVRLHLLGVPEGLDNESDLARNPKPRVAVGGGLYSNCDDRGQWNRGWTIDGEFRWKGLFANATLVRFHNGAAIGIAHGLGYSDEHCGGISGVPPQGNVAVGASATVQYLLPHLLFPVKNMGLELLARWDYVSPNSPWNDTFLGGGVGSPGYVPPPNYADADNPPTRWRLTFGLNWFPTASQRLRLSFNYQMNRFTEHVVISGQEYVGIKNDIVWVQMTLAL